MMAGTVADNIRLGRPEASDDEVAAAADAAGLPADVLTQAVTEGGAGVSAGQRRRVGLARVLVRRAPIVLLDEPTRGLDYPGKVAFGRWLNSLADAGCSILVATHDVELVAVIGDRVIVLADGEVVTDADVRTALTSSPAFAPQVQKVLAPLPVLTVEEACSL